MKTLVIYDSVFGNTEKIARSIAGAIGTQAVPVSQVDAAQLHGLDLLVVGSPTRKFSPTEGISKLLNGLSKNHLSGARVAAFDTCIDLETIDSKVFRFVVDKGGYAAKTIAKSLEKKGGQLAASGEGFYVTGEQGPLKDGKLERAAKWAGRLASAARICSLRSVTSTRCSGPALLSTSRSSSRQI